MIEHEEENTLSVTEDAIVVQAPGLLLKAQREAAGLSYQTVGDALHLTVHYIKALENDDYTRLPGLTFVKGYFRSYARYLNMDVEPVLEAYEKHLAAQGMVSTASEFAARSRSKSDQAIIWAFVAGFILIIALVAGWWFFGRNIEVAQSPVAVRNISSTNGNAATRTGINGVSQTPGTAGVSRSFGQSSVTSNQGQTSMITATSQGLSSTPAAGLSGTESANTSENSKAAAGTSDTGLVTSQGALPGSNLPQPDAAGLSLTEAQAVSQAQAATQLQPVTDLQVVATNTGVQSAENAAIAAADGNPVSALAEATQTGPGSESTGTRIIRLLGTGNDLLELKLNSNSWAEIEDADRVNLYNDMLRVGDLLAIQGKAPFYVLLGDARGVEVNYNSDAIDIKSLIRDDNTARFELNSSGLSATLNSN